MLACVYPSENFKSKAVTVKLRRGGRSKKRTKLLSVKKENASTSKNPLITLNNELPVGGGGAVLVLSELESMATRQQREIAQQRRLLEQREARLAVLRGAQEPAQQDRLARLRHRLDQQQSKLNRLRLLRSQTDASRANNATLTSDLDCIKALFNEKEKELSLAVAKVEELTRQLEELRGRHNGSGAPGGGGHLNTPASAELEKLRRELMYRNKMNEQQNQVVSQQRLALVQRQAEMASIDARIAQLQGRLQRKRALNQRLSQQLPKSNSTSPGGTFAETKTRPAGNIAAIEPYSHIPNDNDFTPSKNDPKYQTLPYNTKFTLNFKASSNNATTTTTTTTATAASDDDVNKNKIQQNPSASQIAQRPQFPHQIAHSQSQVHNQGQSQPTNTNQQSQPPVNSPNQQQTNAHPLNAVNNNVSAVNNLTANNNQNVINNNNNHTANHNFPQEAQNIRLFSQQIQKQNVTSPNNQTQNQRNHQTHQKPVSSVAPSFPVKSTIYQTSSTKIHPVQPQTLSLIGRSGQQPLAYPGIPVSISSNHVPTTVSYQAQGSPNLPNHVGEVATDRAKHEQQQQKLTNDHSSNKYDNQAKFEQQQQQQHGKSFEPPIKSEQNQSQNFKVESPGQAKFEQLASRFEVASQQSKHDHGTKLEPPTKLPEKPFEFERKQSNVQETNTEDKSKPALPPKPTKPNPPPRLTHHENNEDNDGRANNATELASPKFDKDDDVPPIPTSEPPESPTENQINKLIKAKPLSLKKTATISDQPKLRYAKANVHVSINRRIEMPPAFLFPENEIPADLMQADQQIQNQQQQQQHTQIQSQQIENCENNSKKTIVTEDLNSNEKVEDIDIVDALNIINIEDQKLNRSDTIEIESKPTELHRRKKGNLKSSTGKVNLSRRVSFDPLALLLDASLEGELELVKKTAKEVANPSSANDEGITALHNAICAGHLEIVKFLVEFGCDVNAQDSDGWTPLHCAASCNNLAMVRFLVEHGACIFATTLSDHETAAEKCEEDEEGFDGCSEYLYSVQEKLGIMNNGQVFAVFDYDAQHSDELSLKNGDSLVILRKGDDNEREWWWSKLGHREGYVPRNLLGLYPRVQPSKVD